MTLNLTSFRVDSDKYAIETLAYKDCFKKYAWITIFFDFQEIYIGNAIWRIGDVQIKFLPEKYQSGILP